MTALKAPHNGGSNNGNKDLANAKIEFPVTFQLKAVMDKTSTDDGNKEKIVEVLNSLEIKNKYLDRKASSKGTYTSYNYQVTLVSKLQLETLYDKLKTMPGLKFAI